MGTRRLWLAVLLALLQCAAVRASAPPADCSTAVIPMSKCPSTLAAPDCVPMLKIDEACAAPKKLFFAKNHYGHYAELSALVCDAAKQRWKATTKAPVADHIIGGNDNVICSKGDPPQANPIPCKECDAGTMGSTVCDPLKGCQKAVNRPAPDVSGACMTMKCHKPATDYFFTNLPQRINEITCDGATKNWMFSGQRVTHFACVTNVLCHKRDTVKSACASLEAHECKAIDLAASDDEKKCAAGEIMYFKKGNGQWMEAEKLQCEPNGVGLWKALKGATPTILDSADQVICAKNDPNKPAPCPIGHLHSDCDAVINANAKAACKNPTFPTTGDSPVTCPAKTYYKDGAAEWIEAAVKCESAKWKAGNVDLPTGTNVVCSTQNPNALKCVLDNNHLDAVKCNDPTVNAAKGCIDDGVTRSPPDGPLTCPPGSPQTTLYYKKEDQIPWTAVNIQCDPKTGKWTDGTNALDSTTKVVCAKEPPNLIPCQKPLLESDCGKGILNPKPMCDPDITSFPNDGSTVSCATGTDLYYMVSGKPWKTHKAPIKCNRESGDWVVVGTTETLLLPTNVICAKNDPGRASCDNTNHLESDCKGISVSACEPVTMAGEDIQQCILPKTLLFKKGDDPWTKTDSVSCNTASGAWEEGSAGTNTLVAGNNLICSEDPIANSCPALLYTCPAGANACKEPTGNPMVCSGGKLYFKKAAVAKYQEATTVKCDNKEWTLEYYFGKEDATTLRTEKLDAGDSIVCAAANPDPKVCLISTVTLADKDSLTYEFVLPTTRDFEAGKPAKCDDPNLHEFMVATASGKLPLPGNIPPVCDTDGKWYYDGELFGDKVACAIRKCRKCVGNPVTEVDGDTVSTLVGVGPLVTFQPGHGECIELKCPGTPNFVAKSSETDKYFASSVVCSDSEPAPTATEPAKRKDKYEITFESRDQLGAEVKEVKKVILAQCSQKVYCIVDNFPQINYKCPIAPNEIPGCKDAAPANEGSLDGAAKNVLECPDTTKMFVKRAGLDCFDGIEAKKINCNEEVGKWDVTRVNEYGKSNAATLDYRDSIICVESNPKPCPTTTTTTTTPAPILPICEVCNGTGVLPEAIGCDKCDRNHFKLGQQTDDICTMTSDSMDYKLVINSMEEVSILICKRDANPKWTKEGGTEAIVKVDARVEQKRDKLLPMAYGIIAAAIVAIGGMAIAFVMIYIKMRKQSSDRENKKKERGVTKKYTASNVMKTGGKSSKKSNKKSESKEAAGTSKEATSKAESNLEDAPTLKL